jgi:hypothetical protein
MGRGGSYSILDVERVGYDPGEDMHALDAGRARKVVDEIKEAVSTRKFEGESATYYTPDRARALMREEMKEDREWIVNRFAWQGEDSGVEDYFAWIAATAGLPSGEAFASQNKSSVLSEGLEAFENRLTYLAEASEKDSLASAKMEGITLVAIEKRSAQLIADEMMKLTPKKRLNSLLSIPEAGHFVNSDLGDIIDIITKTYGGYSLVPWPGSSSKAISDSIFRSFSSPNSEVTKKADLAAYLILDLWPEALPAACSIEARTRVNKSFLYRLRQEGKDK